jgi:glyoxylase-like metal-dependent hydrolase (beta-lactamase superfamily II)
MAGPARATVERLVAPDGEGDEHGSAGSAAGGGRNVWFVGDDAECAVVDPVGGVADLLGQCAGRQLRAIIWTTIWPESVGTALALAKETGAMTYLRRDDFVIWRQAEPERRPQSSVPQGMVLKIGGMRLEAIATPGITPGALCWYLPALAVVFTGQTLGAEGWDWENLPPADRSTLMASIRTGLFSLPSQTVVHPGHGEDTRIGTQRWDRRFWS